MQRKLQRQTSTGNAVRVHKAQSLKRLLISLEHLLSADKNVFSRWAELGGCGPALIQTRVGRSKQHDARAKKLSLLPGLLAWVQHRHKCRGAFGSGLSASYPSVWKSWSVCKEHAGEPKIAVMANN